MFRLWFLTFFGEYRGPNPETAGHGHDADAQHAGHAGAAHDAQDARAGGSHGHGAPHESPWVMVVPLMILALLSLVGGWVGVPHSLHGSDHFDHFLSPVFARRLRQRSAAEAATAAEGKPEAEDSSTELIFSWHLGRDRRARLLLAWYLYYKRTELPATNGQGCRRPVHAGARQVQDRRTLRRGHHPAADLAFDQCLLEGHRRGLIDGAVDGGAAGAQEISDAMRHMQSGNIRSYAGWVAVGAAAVIAFMVWRGLR